MATFASQDGEPTVIPIEDVERLSRAYRKQTATALKEAKDGKDRPTRGTPAGLIPVLEVTGGLTIVPMKPGAMARLGETPGSGTA